MYSRLYSFIRFTGEMIKEGDVHDISWVRNVVGLSGQARLDFERRWILGFAAFRNALEPSSAAPNYQIA